MRHSVSRFLAASSLALALCTAHAATRPHFGGTLRIEMRAAPILFVPDSSSNSPDAADDRITSMVFETLARLDSNGTPQPGLAISWERSPDSKRWVFTLRPDVKLHNGAMLQSATVAASLQSSNPGWKVQALADTVVLESETPVLDMPAELARASNAIVARESNKTPIGTGPLRMAEGRAGVHARLQAFDYHWAGRPFLDSIEITIGRSLRDHMVDWETGKADVVEPAMDQVRRVMQENRKLL